LLLCKQREERRSEIVVIKSILSAFWLFIRISGATTRCHARAARGAIISCQLLSVALVDYDSNAKSVIVISASDHVESWIQLI
jgi:hypothetical protein